MHSLIEQAAQRLEQLRQAGADMPAQVAGGNGTQGPSPAKPGTPSVPVVPPPPPPPQPPPPVPPPAARTAHLPVHAAGSSRSRTVEIDLERLSRSGIVTPLSPRSQVADQFRVIKRPLIRNAVGKGAADIAHGNLIMVTSALPGEGKTFTSINLAMSLASELDTTVLLVDADVTRPSVMRTLGLPPGPGLLDLVQDESMDPADTLLRTNIDKLVLLPSGTAHPRATELLASDAMVSLLQQMASRYADRIIVFDSPPLLQATESRVLASHMGQVVIVVRAGYTLRSDVELALSAVENCPVRLLLLNQARLGAHTGYGYDYGHAKT